MIKTKLFTNKRVMFPLSFFLFISYIIFLADTADLNIGLLIVKMIPYGDKVLHAILYGIMAMLLNYGLEYKKVYRLQLGAVIVLTFATIEEFSQYFIATRTFDLGDLLADFIGIVVLSLWKLKF